MFLLIFLDFAFYTYLANQTGGMRLEPLIFKQRKLRVEFMLVRVIMFVNVRECFCVCESGLGVGDNKYHVHLFVLV